MKLDSNEGGEGEGGRPTRSLTNWQLCFRAHAEPMDGGGPPRRLLTPQYLDLRGMALVLDNLNTLVR